MLKIYLKEKREIFEKKKKKKMTELKYPERLAESMIYSVMNGGKRLRPVLMYMIADIFNQDYSRIEDTAAALECIHSYSLVHDDLPAMDDDTYRRGKLTTHKKFDEATAILAGDEEIMSRWKGGNLLHIKNSMRLRLFWPGMLC